MLACFCWGLDNQLTSIVDSYSPEFITFLKGIVGGGINLGIGVFIANSFNLITNISISAETIIYGLILGMISYGLSIVLFVITAQNIGATRSQILFSTAPFWGILFSIAIIKEPFSWELIASIALLIAGIISINILVHEHQHSHEDIGHIHTHSHDDEHHDHDHNHNPNPNINININPNLNYNYPNYNNYNNGYNSHNYYNYYNSSYNQNYTKKHSHYHKHKKIKHNHKHFPDLHHKHDH
ncbi:MAG: DMT family transporter [Methanobrevibacter sp.]|nr:DMT family transporter [Methanobrevibacter sp.]